jgi:hypothetical protein
MNKKDIENLKEIKQFLSDAINHLKEENIFICLSGDIATEKENRFFNCNNKQLTPMVKFCGSKIAYFLRAEELLNNLIMKGGLKE